MTNSLFEAVVHATRVLTKYGLTVEELAAVVEQNDMSDAEVLAVSKVFDCLLTKQEISTVNFMLRTSRLPMKVPKTLTTLISAASLARMWSGCAAFPRYPHFMPAKTLPLLADPVRARPT